MTIVRHDPFRLFTFPRFDDWDSSQNGLKIHEDDKNIIAEAVVAGVPSKNVEVNIEDGVITIKADVSQEEKSKDEYRSSSYSYYYTAALSGGQWDKAEAEVKDGIVIVTIPKTPSSRPRKIEIKTKAA